MARILVVEQHPRRGFEACERIAAHLELSGHETRLSLTGTHLFTNLVEFEPHVVYMPWATPTVCDFIRERSDRTVIVNAFQEQGQLIENASSTMVSWAQLADHLFLWGDAFEERASHLFEDMELTVTGNPRYDLYLDEELARKRLPERGEFASRFDLSASRRWVLCALDFPLHFESRERLQELREMEVVSDELLESISEVYELLVAWVNRFAEEPGDSVLILRPHPGSDRDALRRDFPLDSSRVVFREGDSIVPWLRFSDALVTRGSTTMIEAWLAGKPAAAIGWNRQPARSTNRPHMRKVHYRLNDFESFRNFTDRHTESSEEVRARHGAFCRKMFAALDGSAATRTAQRLDQIARAVSPLSYRRYPLADLNRRLQWYGKYALNVTGLNKINPFDRPNDVYLSRSRGRELIERAKEAVQ